MTMHLTHPSLSMSGKRKGKVKFRNADEARKSRELAAEWEQKQKEWAKLSTPVTKKKVFKPAPSLSPQIPSGRFTSNHIPSRVTPGGSTAPVHREYTGNQVLGVTIIHKSCLQPVFSQQEAIDAANMRR